MKDGEVLPTWVPVLFGILTPICFTSSNVLLRTLTDEKYGFNFNGTNISMTSIAVVNVLVVIFAIVFWQFHHFSPNLYWIGLVGSIVNTIGLTCMNTAISCGPMGPVASIGASSTILLVIVDAIASRRVPNYVELIALVLGFGGALELVIPDQLASIFTCGCFRKKAVKQAAKTDDGLDHALEERLTQNSYRVHQKLV